MNLYRFSGTETDWVAADTLADARSALMAHYGISAEDVAMSYDTVDQVDDPSTVYVEPEGWTEDHEDEDWTAADVMETMSGPGLVASTYQ